MTNEIIEKRINKKVRVPLTQGFEAIIDESDARAVLSHKWCVKKSPRLVYAQRKCNGSQQMLHHFLLGKKSGYVVDHVNGDGLDNRRSNLRFCLHSENIRNSRPREGSKGTSFLPKKKKWRAYITVNYKQTYLGSYKTQNEAHAAYLKASKTLHGEFSRTK